MATQQQEQSKSEYRKEVMVKCYTSEGGLTDLYEWASSVTGVDLVSKESYTTTRWYVTIEAGRRTFEERLLAGERYEGELNEVKKKLSRSSVDEVDIKKEVKNKTSPVNNRRGAARDIISFAMSCGPEVIAGDRELEASRRKYQDQRDRTSIKVDNIEWCMERVLAKEEKRVDDELYETLGDVPCLSFRLVMESPNKNHIESWTEQVIPPLHKNLSRLPNVGRVRYTQCTVSEQQEGECYDL